MVSSTFTDLEQHRAALIKAIKGQGLTDIAMENNQQNQMSMLLNSLFTDGSELVCLYWGNRSKYGQTPICPTRNPNTLSITELNFNEALRLGRPILLFIMEEKHLLREADIEIDPANREKLNAFRERAKMYNPDSLVPAFMQCSIVWRNSHQKPYMPLLISVVISMKIALITSNRKLPLLSLPR